MLVTRPEDTGFPIELTIDRTYVCERVEIKKVVPEQFIEAKPAEHIPKHVEVVYEWKCTESLLNGK